MSLETVSIEGVAILSAGGPYYGTGSPPEGDFFDVDDLHNIARANTELASEYKVPLKLGHSKEQRLLRDSGLFTDEMPAAGWVENLRVQGDKLLADLRAVPRKLATLFEAGAFPQRSAEINGPVFSQRDGRGFGMVITGLALLGAKAPAIRTLDDMLALYSEQDVPLRQVRTVEAAVAAEPYDERFDQQVVTEAAMQEYLRATFAIPPTGYVRSVV